eukprot:scpid52210/ scgid5728/ Protein decapentaplegic
MTHRSIVLQFASSAFCFLLCSHLLTGIAAEANRDAMSAAESRPGSGNGRPVRRREWDTMHHVVRSLMTARLDPDTGMERTLSEAYLGTPLEKAEGIYTALGRTRMSKRGNKLRFSLNSLVSSRTEEFTGKQQPGYMVPDVFRAELLLFKTPAHLPVRQRQVPFANLTVTSPLYRGAVGKSVVSLRQTRWESVDVTEFVRDVVQSPTRGIDFGFHARSMDRHGRRLTVNKLFDLTGERNNTQRPVLVIYLREPVDPLQYILVKAQEASEEMEARKKREALENGADDQDILTRSRREAELVDDNTVREADKLINITDGIHDILSPVEIRSDLCQRHDMYLDFSDIGWDHIVAPTGFDPGSCKGVCVDPLTSSTNHAIVRSWAYRNEHPEVEGQPIPIVCCIPTRFSSMTLVIQEEEGDILKSDLYFDMTAEACGCR